jgi:hypothetical protein
VNSEWTVLALRIAVIAIVYLFLFQVAFFGVRRLRAPATFRLHSVPGRLLVLDPGESQLARGEHIPLASLNSLGRSPESSIRLDDTFVSFEHALLSYRDRLWWLEDLGSTNGTLLNRHPVNGRVPAGFGDIIDIGSVKLRLEQG